MKFVPHHLVVTLFALLLIAGCSSQDTVITEEGLEIRDIEVGSGEPVEVSDFVTIHFEGSIEEGEVFESTYMRDEPIVIQVGVGQLPIEGWDKGMIGMRAGGKRTLLIPPNLAFGEQGIEGFIGANENIIMEIELLSITKPPAQWPYSNTELSALEDGVQYVIHEQGNDEVISEGDAISLHYSGYLEDGTLFDSSIIRDMPLDFVVGESQIIPGLSIGLQNMSIGEKRTVVIPPDQAYGEQGAGGVIPPNSTLVFDVELISIN